MSYLLIKATNAHHVNENIPIVFKLITIYFDKHRLFSTYQFSSELSTVFNTRQMGQSTVQTNTSQDKHFTMHYTLSDCINQKHFTSLFCI